MINRTVKVLGWGADEMLPQATITAILDGKLVFSGKIDLVTTTEENSSKLETIPTLFTFDIPMDFLGVKHMVITVNDSTVRFGQILINYAEVDLGGITYSTGAEVYVDMAEKDSFDVCDPRGNAVIINGEKQTADRAVGKGTWHWTIPPGSTFEHELTILPGLEED